MKKRTGLYVVLVILVLVIAVLAVNFTLRGNRYDTAIPVRTFIVSQGALEDRVTGNGTFKPEDAVNVTAQVSAEVESVRVTEGDRVGKGGLLMKLRDGDYALAAEKAKAALDSTRNNIRQSLVTLRAQYRSAASTLADARRTYQKNKSLFASKAISEEVLQKSLDAMTNAEVNIQSIKEQLNLRCGYPLDSDPKLTPEKDDEIVEAAPEVEQARLSLQSAEDNVRRCSITAPIGGTVTDVKPSVGDMVAPSAPVARIETLDRMLAEIQIDEVDIGKIRLGQSAEITSDSLIGETLRGVVDSIAPTVTSLGSTRAALVDVKVTRDDHILRSGASCAAKISTNTKQGVLLVPLASFVTEENTAYVYQLTPTGKKNAKGAEVYLLSKKQIKTGVSDVNSIEVTSGLAEGDIVVTGNLKLLRDGIMVTARQD